VLACFFLSGTAGLVYQVAWGKALGLVFGHTAYAVATVVAVFMGGLALGSALLGRWSESHARPVALYGWVELGVAATGALSLAGLAGVQRLYVEAYPALSDSGVALVGLRVAAAAIVLFLPTFLMGGTLPILVRGLTRTSAELGARVSRLYWVNTAGAVAGTLGAGFVLLPALGLRRTVALAVALNVVAGVISLALAGRLGAVATPPALPRSADAAGGVSRFLLAAFALVGATAIAYEVAWTRLLATMLGSSTYAFTLMLGTFLAGIVVGSLLFERWTARGREPTLGTFAATQTLTAAAALAFLVFFQQLPQMVPTVLKWAGQSFAGLVLAQFVTSALAMLPAAVVFGFNFPVVTVLIAGRPETSGRYAAAVGRAYAANTLGAILGALVTGFVLLRAIGSFRAVALAAAANVALALALQFRRAPRPTAGVVLNGLLLVLVGVAGFSGAFYNRALATFATVLYWERHGTDLTVAEMAATTDTVFAEDGLNATISVARTEDYLSLRTNGKVDASNRDTITQLMLGHLGAVFHPGPRRVLVIGFGSGMTVSALALYPEVERIDCVEIESSVVRAAPHLEPLNRGILRDPRVRIIFDDARNYLLTTRETYDLIISEPSNPWIAGVASLFTEEFYREARTRLRPGGAFVQWVQAYSLFPEDVRMILATFLPHFPQVTLWRGESADFLLLARLVPQPLTLDRLRALWSNAALARDFKELHLRQPEGILGYHLLDDADLRRLADGAPRNTDDHTRLEYRAPRALLVAGQDVKNRDLARSQRTTTLSRIVRVPDCDAALLAAAETLVGLEDYSEVGYFLEPASPDANPAAAALLRGQWELARGRLVEAKAALQRALQLDPGSLDAAHGLAEVARRQLQFDSAELLLRQILARAPEHVDALDSMAHLERMREHWNDAAAWQARRLAADPAPPSLAHARLGEFLLRADQLEAAEGAFRRALELDPYSYSANRNLGELYRRQRKLAEAEKHLAFTARFFPDTDAGTYVALAEVYFSRGRASAGLATLRKGRRIFPTSPELHAASPPRK
jgi:spermidine synthase